MRAATSRTFYFAAAHLAILAMMLLMPCDASAQSSRNRVKRASSHISRQEPPRVSARLMDKVNQDNSRVLISLSRQRAYLILGEEVVVDTPISSGKSAGMTPIGSFKITEKDPDHKSNIYGNFVDAAGRVVRSGVSVRIDSAPSGTRFAGAPMKWFMRFNGAVGMHVGHLPGYPASHGCVRLPTDIAPLIYRKVKNGTPVQVVQ